MTRRLAPLAALFFLSQSACAHHFWLEPKEFAVWPRDAVPVKIVAADGLKAGDREERKFDPDRIDIFQRLSSAGTADIAIKGSGKPTYVFNAGRAGTYVLAMEMNWARAELAPDKFEQYLRGEGLDEIVAERARLGESAKAGRERYRRSLKTMLQVGKETDGSYGDAARQRLELVPLANPYSARIGQPFVVRVTFDDKPLAGRTLVAESTEGEKQSVRTDAEGRATINLDGRGLWLLHMVHMRRCTASDCNGADWESYWSSLTFAR